MSTTRLCRPTRILHTVYVEEPTKFFRINLYRSGVVGHCITPQMAYASASL